MQYYIKRKNQELQKLTKYKWEVFLLCFIKCYGSDSLQSKEAVTRQIVAYTDVLYVLFLLLENLFSQMITLDVETGEGEGVNPFNLGGGWEFVLKVGKFKTDFTDISAICDLPSVIILVYKYMFNL